MVTLKGEEGIGKTSVAIAGECSVPAAILTSLLLFVSLFPLVAHYAWERMPCDGVFYISFPGQLDPNQPKSLGTHQK